jgi:diguanylate cyclase (GGDEF)-like protein
MISFALNRHKASPRAIYAGAAFLILITIVVNVAVISHLREGELRYEEGQLRNIGLIMAEQGDRTFLSVDLAISSVADGGLAEGVIDVLSFDSKMASYGMHVLIQEKLSGVPQLDAITVLDRDGKMINFSRSWPVPELNASDRTYFHALKADPKLKTYVSEPVQNHATGTWIIFLAHRVSGANGEFLGVVIGGITVRYFDDFYEAISLADSGTIALQRFDGVMLARFPRTDAIGKVFANSQRLLPDGVSGTLRERSPIDGQMRIKAVHVLTDYPVLVVVTKTEEAALANWRGIARLMSLGAFGCVISLVIAAFAFGRHWKQQARVSLVQTELGRQEERSIAMQTAVAVSRAATLKMAYSAEHDFLTGLPNRMLLGDRISQAIALAHRHEKKVAVLFLDLDGFKHINDSLGHSIGDKLLQSVAQRLVACVRGSDTVSRQGGDEFVVLLSEVDQPGDVASAALRISEEVAKAHSIDHDDPRVDAAIAAKKMLAAVGETHSIARHELHVTASIGVSVYPDDGPDAETLIQNADTAMYQAKEHGRQSFQFFRPEMNVLAVERQFIEESLGHALPRHEFALNYQPIIDLRTGEVTGAEALLRWTHPTRGLIPPAQFIPVAEDCGLIVPIGTWVLREACEQAQAWLNEGLPKITMAVNVSAIEFRRENFLQNVFQILTETGFDPRSLVLELTEGILMKHAESAVAILQALRERGVQVAVDDFGTGYSSLGYLQKFPLDALKIDQSFIRQISAPGEDTAIVTAVIGLAQSLRLRVIAEGVEGLQELLFLQAHHCEEAQGYYFSRPVVPRRFVELLKVAAAEPDYMLRGGNSLIS